MIAMELRPKVVFLDDETPILRALERTFRREAFEVLTTENPHQALEWSKDPGTRLVISDYRMPGTTGLEVLQLTRDLRPELQRFILSGYADEELIKQALHTGDVHQYLLKPWNVDDLRARILAAVL